MGPMLVKTAVGTHFPPNGCSLLVLLLSGAMSYWRSVRLSHLLLISCWRPPSMSCRGWVIILLFAMPRLLLRWCRLRISWLLLVLRRCLIVITRSLSVLLLLLLGVIIALLVLWCVTPLPTASSPTSALTSAGCGC